MDADHSHGRRSLSSPAYNASPLFAGRVNGEGYPTASSSLHRRHSSNSHSLRRFPSLSSVTELFQARPRSRLGPTSMRRKISHLLNHSKSQHRRATSDTAALAVSDTASRHRPSAAPVVSSPLQADHLSLVDEWSATELGIERQPSSWRHSSSSASATSSRPFTCPASDSSIAPTTSASSTPSFAAMPVSHRRHRSSAGRRGKRIISSAPVATVASLPIQGFNDGLSAKVEVVFETDVIDIVGSPNTSVTYSLPGAVFLTFPALSDIHQGHVRLLHDVSVVLEGKAEYWDDSGRFSPFRLFTTTLPLIPADRPIAIPSSTPASPLVTVRLDFDLRIPGWLPPSLQISGRGSCAGVGYGVVATAVTSWCDFNLVPAVSLAHIVQQSSFSPYCEFTIRRHQMPTAILPDALIESRSFIHTEEEKFSYDMNLGTAILPVEATFTVPDVIDVYGDERALSVGIRIRIQPESYQAYRLSRAAMHAESADADAAVAYLMELGMIVEERHRFSSTPYSQYMGYFPVPTEQPTFSSRYSLLGPRFAPQEETSFRPDPNVRCRKDVLRPCLLSDEGYQRNFVFDEGGIGLSDRWRRINVVLLLPSRHGSGNYRPRPGAFTPFVHISHALKTFCTLRTPGVLPESRPITFTTALKFATNPATLPSSASANPPPFLQLYDESGEPRLPDPLPLYSPAAEMEDPMVELPDAPFVAASSSDIPMSRQSSEAGDEELPCRKPFDHRHRGSLDISSPGNADLRGGDKAPPDNDEAPKAGHASGSRARSLAFRNVDEQV